MTRINITETGDYGDTRVIGWFNEDKAVEFKEDTDWDDISVNTRSQWDHQSLYRTAQGRWVLCCYSNRQGFEPTYEFVGDDKAREWLILNMEDQAVADHFGEVEEERGPGRPAIGDAINVRLGDQLEPVDTWAAEQGVSRAEAIRSLITRQLAAEQPFAISGRDIATGRRETLPGRWASLGAAVEQLRKWDADDDDQVSRGLPSALLQIEEDGRTVDPEVYS